MYVCQRFWLRKTMMCVFQRKYVVIIVQLILLLFLIECGDTGLMKSGFIFCIVLRLVLTWLLIKLLSWEVTVWPCGSLLPSFSPTKDQFPCLFNPVAVVSKYATVPCTNNATRCHSKQSNSDH